MPISQQGALNTTALIVPGVYVQIVPPQVSLLNGVPTNILGIVGTASWGPVNSPVATGNMTQYAQQFGAIQPRKYDMGTAVVAATLQGAANFRCVRVTDGTDLAASTTVTCSSAGLAAALANALNQGVGGLRGPSQLVVASANATTLTLTAKYTGSLGNSIAGSIGAGTAATTAKLTLALPNQPAEVFDNIGGGAQASATLAFSGGTDGATAITGSVLIGQDTVPRKGMYALRGTGASVAMLADCDDSTTWSTQVSYGLSEGTYMIMTGPAGDTISNAVSSKAMAGIDSYAGKLLFGDWVYFADPVNNITRLISPQGFAAGVLANLAPQSSSLNKPIWGVVGTQKSYNSAQYSAAELQSLGAAGIDAIANPSPGGTYFSCAFGHNTASSAAIHGDNYTRMTNSLAATLAAGMGQFVGKLQGPAANDPTRRNVKATLDNFLSTMQLAGQVAAFQVVCDTSNNTPASIASGQLNAGVRITYLSVVEDFLVNLEGGQSVQIQKQNTAPLAA